MTEQGLQWGLLATVYEVAPNNFFLMKLYFILFVSEIFTLTSKQKMLRLSEGQGKLKIMYFWISSKLARSTGFFSNKGPAWKEITHALKDHHHGGLDVAMQLHAKKKCRQFLLL